MNDFNGAGEPRHHPPEALLIQHAAGQLDAARRITVEAHAGFCHRCRRALAGWTAPGAEVLASSIEAPPAPSAWAALEARLETLEPADEAPPFAPPPALPPGLRGLLPPRFFAGPWRHVPLSSARYTVALADRQARVHLLLVWIGAGKRFPRHQHQGYEDVVVLEGAFSDPQGQFRAGDFQLSRPGTTHGPEVQPGRPCWVLSRLEHGIRFMGVRGLLQRLAR